MQDELIWTVPASVAAAAAMLVGSSRSSFGALLRLSSRTLAQLSSARSSWQKAWPMLPLAPMTSAL
jgi:hypothetical protein